MNSCASNARILSNESPISSSSECLSISNCQGYLIRFLQRTSSTDKFNTIESIGSMQKHWSHLTSHTLKNVPRKWAQSIPSFLGIYCLKTNNSRLKQDIAKITSDSCSTPQTLTYWVKSKLRWNSPLSWVSEIWKNPKIGFFGLQTFTVTLTQLYNKMRAY